MSAERPSLCESYLEEIIFNRFEDAAQKVHEAQDYRKEVVDEALFYDGLLHYPEPYKGQDDEGETPT